MAPAAQRASARRNVERALPALRQLAGRLTSSCRADPVPPLDLGRPLLLGNQVTVIPVGVRHSTAFYRAHEQRFRSMVASADFVVLELDPDRIEHQCARNSLDRETGEFYRRLFELAWEHQKPVLHVDPDTAITTNLNLCSAAMASVLAGAGTASLMAAARRPGRANSRAWSTQAAIGAIAGTYLLTATTPGVAAVETLVSKGQLASKPLNPLVRGNPLSHLDFRNAGAILGLARAAQEHLVQGRGYYFVGAGHLTDYLAYAENRAAALKAYRNNVYRLICEHVLRARPQARVFKPTIDGAKYAFEVERSVPLL